MLSCLSVRFAQVQVAFTDPLDDGLILLFNKGMQLLALAAKTLLLLLEIQPQESVHLINLVGSRPSQILQLLWHLVEVLTELI